MEDFYVSCIKINGKPILPPLLSEEKRVEMQGYRDLALQIELKIKDRSVNVAVELPEDLRSVTTSFFEPLSPAPTDSTDLNLGDVDTSSEATFNTSFGRGLVRSDSYTLETPSQALLDSIAESEVSETSTLKEKKRSSIPKFTCVRKKSAKVATIYSPKRRKSMTRKHEIVETEESEETVVEVDYMDNLIKSMREEYELKLEMLRKQQEEEKAKLREEFLSQQNVLFEKLAISPPQKSPQSSPMKSSPPERSHSPPIKPDKSPTIVVSRNLNELTTRMAQLPLGALVRGYFVRRLHKTDRVETIKSAIKETICLAINLHEQPPPMSAVDIDLHGRLIQQLDQSLNELHLIFFELPVHDQLKIISADRERMLRGSLSHRSSTSSRVSSATERRQEMRRRSQQENLTPKGRVDKGRKIRRRSNSKSPKSILTESAGFDGGNYRLNKNQIPWR